MIPSNRSIKIYISSISFNNQLYSLICLLNLIEEQTLNRYLKMKISVLQLFIIRFNRIM